MKPEITIQRNDNEACCITLTGDLSIRNSKDIQQALLLLVSSDAKEKEVLIHLPAAIDLPLIQLLAAVVKHENAKGTIFKLSSELSDDHCHLFRRTGWLPFLNVTNFNQGI